uniref:Uncharacterized protein n=1 Tax=Sus scrofa TaxID=9823 RepID=A0A8D1UHN0_PIG
MAKTWEHPKCPSTDDWLRKMWFIHTMEYYSAIKKNEIMPYEATCMELETLILSEHASDLGFLGTPCLGLPFHHSVDTADAAP